MKVLFGILIALFALGAIAEKDRARGKRMVVCFGVSVAAMLVICGYIG